MKKFAWVVSLLVTFYSSAATAEDPIVAMDLDAKLSASLLSTYEAMEADYKPRTEHFLSDGRPEYINRLIQEKSPYLLQHAHNPVNWYPFGDEAFERAQKENKPVFLSIGYATCHWCHVMERESFEDVAIADILNEHFIAVKVDREQLPDVDSLYMTAVMMITGRGGWPMSNFLDSGGRPFHGGTYYPPAVFTDLLQQITGLWQDDKPALMDLADQLSDALNRTNTVGAEARDVGERETARAAQLALSIHDDFLGGFGGAPKFPQEALLLFLLNEARLNENTPALNAVNFTLQRMAAGGIHDQIGGGFHRYAVDDEWLVPHFEKMLYNQGLLARAYVQAFQLGGDADHAQTSQGILDYVKREMMSPDGLFYSATDADSEGAEGTFFLWTPETLSAVLDEDEVTTATALWGVAEGGNFEHKSILFRPGSLDEVAEELGVEVAALSKQREAIASKLLASRDERIRPILDDKIITAWNAMMITAFAEVGYALNNREYIDIATQSAEKLWQSVHRDDGSLWRTLYRGETSVNAKQTDYAYLAESFIALYDVDGNESWLRRAQAVTETMVERFWDTEQGGFFLGEAVVEGTKLAIRPKDLHDSSMPSGNAVALRVLAKLYRRTGDEQYNDSANQLIAAFSSNLAQQPSGFYYMLTGASEHLFEETGSHEYAARGVVQVSGQRTDDGSVAVKVNMQPGWHINSHTPTLDYLIPTQLTSSHEDLDLTVEYPQPVMMNLGFESTELSLFENSITVMADVSGVQEDQVNIPLEIRVQACNDEVCLAPETVSFLVPWRSL